MQAMSDAPSHDHAVVDAAAVPSRRGSPVDAPELAALVAGRVKQALGDAVGLTGFGVNLVGLEPGVWSSIRHWHTHEDEFIYILAGSPTLVTDEGERALRPGMIAGFRAGIANGHHLINRTDQPVSYLEIGDRHAEDDCHYPDADLQFRHQDGVFTRKDGTRI
jgi:uncharacterized cupin superfamily protein